MSAALGTHWLVLALLAATLAMACAVAMARSLFAAIVYFAAFAALCAATLVALGAEQAALNLALLCAGLAPVLLLAALLLSARTAKPRRRARPWGTLAAAMCAGAALGWAGADLAPASAPIIAAQNAGNVVWAAALVFAAVLAGVGLLGFGERGALERSDRP